MRTKLFQLGDVEASQAQLSLKQWGLNKRRGHVQCGRGLLHKESGILARGMSCGVHAPSCPLAGTVCAQWEGMYQPCRATSAGGPVSAHRRCPVCPGGHWAGTGMWETQATAPSAAAEAGSRRRARLWPALARALQGCGKVLPPSAQGLQGRGGGEPPASPHCAEVLACPSTEMLSTHAGSSVCQGTN